MGCIACACSGGGVIKCIFIRGSEKTSEVHVYNGGAVVRLSVFVPFFVVEQTTSGMGHR